MFISRQQLHKLLGISYGAGIRTGLSLGKALSNTGIVSVGGYGSKMEQDIDIILKEKGVGPWASL